MRTVGRARGGNEELEGRPDGDLQEENARTVTGEGGPAEAPQKEVVEGSV